MCAFCRNFRNLFRTKHVINCCCKTSLTKPHRIMTGSQVFWMQTAMAVRWSSATQKTCTTSSARMRGNFPLVPSSSSVIVTHSPVVALSPLTTTTACTVLTFSPSHHTVINTLLSSTTTLRTLTSHAQFFTRLHQRRFRRNNCFSCRIAHYCSSKTAVVVVF